MSPKGPGESIRAHFPFFLATGESRSSNYRATPAYLDSAATTQKPSAVIERLSRFLSTENANIHRGAYHLSGVATENYETARNTVGAFINAPSAGIVFTSGTTGSINMAAEVLEPQLAAGDSILLTLLEHHSNIVPWQLVAKRRQAKVHFADVHPSGQIDLEDFSDQVKRYRPKIVAITAVSNALGSIAPVAKLCSLAHENGSLVLVDAAQAIAHTPVDVRQLDCDFLAFSGHKIYGPTGIGVLYGRPAILEGLEPAFGGGGMIASVSTEGSTWTDSPQRFEAGTPAIAEAIGLAAALDFFTAVGFESVMAHEDELFAVAFERLRREPGVKLFGPATAGGAQRSIISFTIEGLHPHDFATVADTFNVQLRAGHHCAMPLLKRLGVQSTARISFGMYSCEKDIEALIEAIRFARKKFA